MKGFVLSLVLACASAFVAPGPAVSSTALGAKSLIPWVEAPEGLSEWAGGEQGFDPLLFSTKWPIEWLREAELKHGRVAMLATTGWITADFVKLPGEIHQVSSLEAHDVAVKSGALTQILIFITIIEATSFVAIKEMIFDKSGRKPGYYAFDPLRFNKADDPEWQLKELRNGRLAMLAFSGIVTQSVLTGASFPYF